MSRQSLEIIEDIRFETARISREFELAVYRANGGVFDEQVDHEKLIADLGPRVGGEVARRLSELRTSMRSLYGLNPARLLEHMEILQKGIRRGWFRTGGSAGGRR
ncbi:hypothetical protein JKL49_11375 [Phenylobacterium sp. 20VBR1]|uniref:Uncharacterized protein n=1 Tax=Phenylobacterium glaciei TaxID=2803784 RepID=A0A941D1X6_9CAUL|nr:hypothetical protein [Phenylobacterium glaciei]MBR7619989.1 hypothetical protein [Phenylobacterium glaciei]